MSQPAISLTLVLRIEMPNEPGAFGLLANTIGDAGGTIGAVDMHTVGRARTVRDVTIAAASEAIANEVRKAVEGIDGRELSLRPTRLFSRISAERFAWIRRCRSRRDRISRSFIHPASRAFRWQSPRIRRKRFSYRQA